MVKLLSRLMRARRGATTLEYAFIVAFIVIAIIVAIRNVGGATLGLWQNSADRISAVVS